jgi:hypothetical protein
MHEWDAYNLFRRKREPTLCCAVPQRRPVPAFIRGETWEFGGTIAGPGIIPLGFQPDAAAEATRLMGYYLFQAFPRLARAA